MDEFYTLLKQYNSENANEALPEWTKIYSESTPPVYWNILKNILNEYSKSSSVFEIGSGAGDLLALILSLGFDNVAGVEKDLFLSEFANKKLEHFFNRKETVVHGEYPISISKPNILIQVNCVYFENIFSKEDYLIQLKSFYQNASPDYFLLEVIDSSFIAESKAFPDFVRLSEKNIQDTFIDKTIDSFKTYEYPINTSSKRLYLIS